jgi:hypothetical protein
MKKKERERKAARRVQKADSDGLTRYKVQVTSAFQESFMVKALNEQQAVQRVNEGFGTSAGRKPPEVVDITVLDVSTAEAKGRLKDEEGGKGLIEVVSG